VAHIPQVVEVWTELMAHHAPLDPLFQDLSPDATSIWERYMREHMASSDGVVFVALDGEEVVGFLMAQLSEYPPVFNGRKHGSIADTAVKEGRRREGIGTMLVARVMEWFKEKGIRRIEVRVAHVNPEGQAFWAKQGFKDIMDVKRLDIES
jgi:ribosomal protein S18 acetylase RimI-like enzyme